MYRKRVKEKLIQPSIKEYFSERKSRKRTAENLKGQDISTSPKAKKISISDEGFEVKHKTRSRSSSSSNLLVSVLKKRATLQISTTKVSRKENNNPNVKNVLDSSKIDTPEITQTSSEIIISNEESSKNERLLNQKGSDHVEENIETPLENIPLSVTPESEKDLKEIRVVKSTRQKKETRTQSSNKLFQAEIPTIEIPNGIEPAENNILKTNCVEKSQLSDLKKSQTKCEESVKSTEKIHYPSQSSRIFLPLPDDYTFLADVFTCIDKVSMMLYNRDVIITFGKLQPALQNMSTREVTLEHLAQIKTIYPAAYSFHKEKMRVIGSGSNKSQYEIVLRPNFESSEEKNCILFSRRRTFYNALLDRVKDEHEKFLMGLSKSGTIVQRDKIKRWHPRFQIEKCKPIELTDLPILRRVELTSPKDVLEKVKECFKVDTNVNNLTQTPERASKQLQVETKQEVEDYRRLPSVAKMVRNIFLSERKNVLTLNQVLQKLQYSSKEKLTLDEVEKQVRLLCQLVPEWISLFNLGRTDRLKIEKKTSFEKVSKIVEAAAKK